MYTCGFQEKRDTLGRPKPTNSTRNPLCNGLLFRQHPLKTKNHQPKSEFRTVGHAVIERENIEIALCHLALSSGIFHYASLASSKCLFWCQQPPVKASCQSRYDLNFEGN